MTIFSLGLLRELSIVIALKLCALFLLWWLFVRDSTVAVDTQSVTDHFNTVEQRSHP
ncbi:hypothetical protein SAMN04488038_109191 [Solimonas aquatica]|uniref:Uncharacterized protein n=1 Tax=Solimonas aquatica TaxID=489703 RepID=A0A1H9I5P6_9GAMM|nr:cytochrome oxidase putative small subunit CydP [Solimonas aquatica]SEQ69883.1 hypothetical protein SAMN04488038_109191 [Solimonas aquatica]